MNKTPIESFIFNNIIFLSLMIGFNITACENNMLDDIDLDFDHMMLEISPDDIDRFSEIEHIRGGFRSPNDDAFAIVQLLNNLGIINLLKFDLWCKTSPANYRNILNYPTLIPILGCGKPLEINVTPFFNRTSKSFFTKKSDNITSYISLFTNNDFLQQLSDAFEKFNQEQGASPSVLFGDVLPLLAQMKLQESRIGVMLNVNSQINNIYVAANLPIYYAAHNFNLTQKQQDAITEKIPFTGQGTPTPSVDWKNFSYQHLVADRIGLGDLLLQLSYCWCTTGRSYASVGAQVQVPTSCSFAKGVFGGTYDLRKNIELFNYTKLYELSLAASLAKDKLAAVELSELFVQYATQALDMLTGNLADTALGQLHAGFGPVAQFRWQLNENWGIEYFIDGFYYLPAPETRLLKVKNNLAEFNRDYNNPDEAEANLAFLTERTNNILYPTPVDIVVKVNASMQTNLRVTYNKEHYGWIAGFDFWANMKQGFGNIKCRYRPGGPLNASAGKSSYAYQGKLFGGIQGTICEPEYTLDIGLAGDVTLFNRGIGKDFTINLILAFSI